MSNWKITLGLTVLCLGLTAYIVWEKLGPEIGTDVEPQLRDSIALIEKQRLELEYKVDSLNRSYDSLLSIKQTIIIKYHEKIKFINGASVDQLDSLIQSSIR